ncbi:gamma carbonic anhydrase family protein [Manganibacter manganicus]|uniref:Transferase n=1 Tax=Manganibacter manganicus TaxID=1873176 RepID=A0A1V8RQR4_9HYPH|nr:gamma carbonic anhydrase family protein [Pseudaminobacter manganicus]OQM75551.1 transferase [Pseudaminobacter manganicus]
MILPDGSLYPKIHPTARIAPNAVISGDVEIGPDTSVGFGTVIVAESGPVRIAGKTVIMENAVLRGIRGCPLHVGRNVLIGPRAVLNGCVIGEEAFIATGATIFNGAIIGARAEVRINAIVHLRTRLAAGAMVPLGWIAVGDPAHILPPDRHEEIWTIQKELDFPSFVFGVARPPEGETIMRDVIPRYAAMLARRHAGDADAGI